MRKVLKIVVAIFASIFTITAIGFLLCNLKPVDIRDKAQALKVYCLEKGYNTNYGILVDYGKVSFRKRLYVYDMNNDKVIMKSLSGHGSGGSSTFLNADFSNVSGSHCSSLGHYKIGKPRHMYNRPAVPAVELAGLDETNSNAISRGILLHPSVGPLSWGCVTLPVFRYHQLSELLKTQKDMIMWVYK